MKAGDMMGQVIGHNKFWQVRMNQTRISQDDIRKIRTGQNKSRWFMTNQDGVVFTCPYCTSNSLNLICNIFFIDQFNWFPILCNHRTAKLCFNKAGID